ncbi:MAG: hypothetical protein SFY69_11215 [Planctomycetota bacterium]|nr:hypothetical protein [Planctomycetota bacterium]
MGDERWVSLLRGAARRGLVGTPLAGVGEPATWARGFADSAGHRRAVDPYLLARVLGLPAEHVDALPGLPPDAESWLRLWRAVAAGDDRRPAFSRDDGPLFPESHDGPIEVWTEGELCGLHALSWLATKGGPAEARLHAAARWLIEHIQPDNATGRPWGVHVFASMGASDPDADMYAQTLLHNALAGRSEPDVFSAVILWDAADWLERGV